MFADKIKKQEEEAIKEGISSQGSGDWYKFTEGMNKFRVLVEPEMIFEKYKVGICYTDCGYEGTARFLTFVLDTKDNKIKLAKLPYTIGDSIAKYQSDDDYSFTDFPMPYDIKVDAKNAGTKEVEYTVIPSPTRDSVPQTILSELSKKDSIKDIIVKMKDKQKQKHIEDGTWQKNQEEKNKLKQELDKVRPRIQKEIEDTIDYDDDSADER